MVPRKSTYFQVICTEKCVGKMQCNKSRLVGRSPHHFKILKFIGRTDRDLQVGHDLRRLELSLSLNEIILAVVHRICTVQIQPRKISALSYIMPHFTAPTRQHDPSYRYGIIGKYVRYCWRCALSPPQHFLDVCFLLLVVLGRDENHPAERIYICIYIPGMCVRMQIPHLYEYLPCSEIEARSHHPP